MVGSPPQVRGKHWRKLRRNAKSRITPAGAGKTMNNLEKRETLRDHPRRCGENPYSQIGQLAILGSPPQVRGKQVP